uniref:Uncharacterized protein n=1 Tax=Vitrella brassicaformis TaxID=1169539 RepID=A0A6U4D005_9ALVE
MRATAANVMTTLPAVQASQSTKECRPDPYLLMTQCHSLWCPADEARGSQNWVAVSSSDENGRNASSGELCSRIARVLLRPPNALSRRFRRKVREHEGRGTALAWMALQELSNRLQKERESRRSKVVLGLPIVLYGEQRSVQRASSALETHPGHPPKCLVTSLHSGSTRRM